GYEADADPVIQVNVVGHRLVTQEWMEKTGCMQVRCGPGIGPTMLEGRGRKTPHRFDPANIIENRSEQRFGAPAREIIERELARRRVAGSKPRQILLVRLVKPCRQRSSDAFQNRRISNA